MHPDATHAAARDRFNREWDRRLGVFHRYASPPWWYEGLTLTPELDYVYERFLPIAEYIHDLRRVVADTLPCRAWLPRVLLSPPYRSLPDFWRRLPRRFHSRVAWLPNDLDEIAVHLASPTVHGARFMRYPEQLPALVAYGLDRGLSTVRCFDFGCGTGQGTYEIAQCLDGRVESCLVIGMTIEPLEAWMASRGRLPNPQPRAGQPITIPYPRPELRSTTCIRFVAGDMLRATFRDAADIIVCNGVIGGPKLNHDADFRQLWTVVSTCLKDGGLLVIGEQFHDGHRLRAARFVALGGKLIRHQRTAGRSTFITVSRTT